MPLLFYWASALLETGGAEALIARLPAKAKTQAESSAWRGVPVSLTRTLRSPLTVATLTLLIYSAWTVD